MDVARTGNNVCRFIGGYRVSAVFRTQEVWNPAVHGERRRGQRRRADSMDPTGKVCWYDDRRLGLGRRWDDWRRPEPARSLSR